MAVKLDDTAPYAPSTAVIEFLTRHRNGALPAPITAQTLERLGISESLRPRTLQALRVLDFITDEGQFAPEMDELRRVPTREYGPKLAEMLRLAYADVFAIVDPSSASHEQVADAFRGFTPAGQMPRMVALFLALLAHTGQWTTLPTPRGADHAEKVLRQVGNRRLVARKVAPDKVVPPMKPPAAPSQSTPEPKADTVYSFTVKLPNEAGTVTLSADVNPMKLKGAVREFFYGLVDAMDEYEQQTSGSQA